MSGDFGAPALAVPFGPGDGRVYRDPETGEEFPSVTTIDDVIRAKALEGWIARVTAEAAYDLRESIAKLDDRAAAVDLIKNARYRSMNKAGLRGSTLHRIMAAKAIGAEIPEYGDEEIPWIASFLAFCDEFEPEFVEVEATVFSDRFKYAGTLDFLAKIRGRLVLGDHKTGSGVYDNHALQLAALRYADRIWNAETGEFSPMPAVDGCVVVHLRPEGFRVVQVNADEEVFAAFCAARALWPWARDRGGRAHAIGPTLSPDRLAKAFAKTEEVG